MTYMRSYVLDDMIILFDNLISKLIYMLLVTFFNRKILPVIVAGRKKLRLFLTETYGPHLYFHYVHRYFLF